MAPLDLIAEAREARKLTGWTARGDACGRSRWAAPTALGLEAACGSLTRG